MRGRPPHLIEVGLSWPPETFLCWKLEGLAARGFRVTLVSRHVIDPEARLSGVRLVALPPVAPEGLRRVGVVLRDGLLLGLMSPRRLGRFLRGLRRHVSPAERERRGGFMGLLATYLPMARLRPDVVHYEWQPGALRHYALFEVWRCPVVISCHGLEIDANVHLPGHEDYASRLPELMRRVDAVHCVSARLEQQAGEFGLDPAKAWVIRQGVDPERFSPRPNGRDRHDSLRVTMIGWLRWMKGLEYALEAIRTVADRGVPVEFHVLGGPPGGIGGELSERQRALHTIDDLDLGDRVRLHGFTDSDEVARRLARTDVLLHPSLSEGLPTVLLEAMSCGVPVVATDCGAVTEAVTHGVEGLVVPPRDPDALAHALERLWREPSLRERMGAAGQARVRRDFTLERQLSEMERMYRTVAAA